MNSLELSLACIKPVWGDYPPIIYEFQIVISD